MKRASLAPVVLTAAVLLGAGAVFGFAGALPSSCPQPHEGSVGVFRLPCLAVGGPEVSREAIAKFELPAPPLRRGTAVAVSPEDLQVDVDVTGSIAPRKR